VNEQRELTQLCVRATMRSGYDEAFIDRVMPGLTITVPLIAGGCVQVAERGAGEVVGVVTVTTTSLQGIALLYGIYVDPAHWRCGVGRMLFEAAATRVKGLKAGALMIYMPNLPQKASIREWEPHASVKDHSITRQNRAPLSYLYFASGRRTGCAAVNHTAGGGRHRKCCRLLARLGSG